jgi:hypothetical protein
MLFIFYYIMLIIGYLLYKIISNRRRRDKEMNDIKKALHNIMETIKYLNSNMKYLNDNINILYDEINEINNKNNKPTGMRLRSGRII